MAVGLGNSVTLIFLLFFPPFACFSEYNVYRSIVYLMYAWQKEKGKMFLNLCFERWGGKNFVLMRVFEARALRY